MTSRSPSATNLSRTAGCRPRIVRVNTSTCSPDTRPASNDSPNSGTAAAVSARRNNRPPLRSEVFAGFGQRLLRERRHRRQRLRERHLATFEPRLQPRTSAITSLERTPIGTAGIDRRHPPNQGLHLRRPHLPTLAEGCYTVGDNASLCARRRREPVCSMPGCRHRRRPLRRSETACASFSTCNARH